MGLVMPAHVTGAATDNNDSRKRSFANDDSCLDLIVLFCKGVSGVTASHSPNGFPDRLPALESCSRLGAWLNAS